jgi:ATP-binding cassette subfamily F protein 3
VRGKKLHHYVGSYSRFIELRAEREVTAAATAAATQAEIERLEEFVARFGAKASKASQAQVGPRARRGGAG